MRQLPHFSAIIFDLDGLVLDTESSYFLAWQQALAKMGYDFSVLNTQSLSGQHYQAVIAILRKNFGQQFDLQRFEQLSSECWYAFVEQHGIQKKPGFERLLSLIQQRDMPFCLATNSAEKNARECLEFAGLARTFSVLVSRDDVQHGKPAPDIFLTAAQRLQQPIAQCLVLEDSLVGIAAAQAAEAIAVFIPSVLPISASAVPENSFVFADLSEVADAIFRH